MTPSACSCGHDVTRHWERTGCERCSCSYYARPTDPAPVAGLSEAEEAEWRAYRGVWASSVVDRIWVTLDAARRAFGYWQKRAEIAEEAEVAACAATRQAEERVAELLASDGAFERLRDNELAQKLRQAEADRDAARAKLDEWRVRYDASIRQYAESSRQFNKWLLDCTAERDARTVEVATLRAVLEYYGRHDEGCTAPCDCGLEKALAATPDTLVDGHDMTVAMLRAEVERVGAQNDVLCEQRATLEAQLQSVSPLVVREARMIKTIATLEHEGNNLANRLAQAQDTIATLTRERDEALAKADHREIGPSEHAPWAGRCHGDCAKCGEHWPCATAREVSEVAHLRRRVAAAEALEGALESVWAAIGDALLSGKGIAEPYAQHVAAEARAALAAYAATRPAAREEEGSK